MNFKIPMTSTNRYGFRLSIVDILMIFSTSLLVYFFPPNWKNIFEFNSFLSLLMPYVVLNFFLFCNVFRIRTRYELYWLASATLNVMFFLFYHQSSIWYFVSQTFFTAVVIIMEIRGDNYHGIFTKPKDT